MCKYTLSINIISDDRELLDNLMITLEAANGDLESIDTIELLTNVGAATYFLYQEPTTLQRNLFLDKWDILDA